MQTCRTHCPSRDGSRIIVETRRLFPVGDSRLGVSKDAGLVHGRIERELGRRRVDLLIVWPKGSGEQKFVVECKMPRQPGGDSRRGTGAGCRLPLRGGYGPPGDLRPRREEALEREGLPPLGIEHRDLGHVADSAAKGGGNRESQAAGLRFVVLGGDRKRTWSLAVTRNRRIVFQVEDGDISDYH